MVQRLGSLAKRLLPKGSLHGSGGGLDKVQRQPAETRGCRTLVSAPAGGAGRMRGAVAGGGGGESLVAVQSSCPPGLRGGLAGCCPPG